MTFHSNFFHGLNSAHVANINVKIIITRSEDEVKRSSRLKVKEESIIPWCDTVNGVEAAGRRKQGTIRVESFALARQIGRVPCRVARMSRAAGSHCITAAVTCNRALIAEGARRLAFSQLIQYPSPSESRYTLWPLQQRTQRSSRIVVRGMKLGTGNLERGQRRCRSWLKRSEETKNVLDFIIGTRWMTRGPSMTKNLPIVGATLMIPNLLLV